MLCSLSLHLMFCSYLCPCLMNLFCSIFASLCLLAHGTLQTGDDFFFFRRSWITLNFENPQEKLSIYLGMIFLVAIKGKAYISFGSQHFLMIFIFLHTFPSSFHFVLHFLKICSHLYFKRWKEKYHLQMPTGKSVYFKQCCSGVPAAVARTAYWLLGVVRRIKIVMSR